LLALLKARVNEWIPLAQVMAVAGPQYGTRIHELRGLGHRIENFQQRDCSWFRLVIKTPTPAPVVEISREPELLFTAEARHRDDG
jgi:hypothetical protein